MDLTETLAPKSDQLNAEDLLTGPRTFTIERVDAGSAEQPVNVHLLELPGRPYRPSKSMRRLIVTAWGAESSAYTGRRITLYRNPEIRFGGSAVGGIEVSHLSHIDKPVSVALTITRGKRKNFAVQPIAEAAPDLSIPDNISTTAQKAIADGQAGEYITWLTEQGAPQHIITWVTEQAKGAAVS